MHPRLLLRLRRDLRRDRDLTPGRVGRVAYGALLACVLGCDAPSGDTAVAAIIGGTPTTGDPAVVGLVIGGEVACTGTLIDPRVVVTAADRRFPARR